MPAATKTFSQIPASGTNPRATDQVVGVSGGTTDTLYSITQIAAAIAVGAIPTARLTTGTSVTVATTDIEVGVDPSSGAVTCTLPTVAAWSTAQQNGLELTIFDYTGHASAHNVSFTLGGSDHFVQSSTPVITSDFGLIKLRPLPTINKWYVRALN